MPDEVRRVYVIAARVLTFGIEVGLEATPLECIGLNGYFWKILFWTLLPAFLIACIVAGAALWLLARRREVGPITPAKLLATAAPLSQRLLFLIYPTVTRIAFQAFSWHHFSDGTSWLRVDVNIQQGSPEAASAASLALVAILLYPVGTFILFGSLLFLSRHAIQKNRPSRLSTAITFLHGEYETGFFWWELVEVC